MSHLTMPTGRTFPDATRDFRAIPCQIRASLSLTRSALCRRQNGPERRHLKTRLRWYHASRAAAAKDRLVGWWRLSAGLRYLMPILPLMGLILILHHLNQLRLRRQHRQLAGRQLKSSKVTRPQRGAREIS